MAKVVLEKALSLLAAVTVFFLFPLRVSADVAPSPVETASSGLPYVLIGAVVICALFLLKKFFIKK